MKCCTQFRDHTSKEGPSVPKPGARNIGFCLRGAASKAGQIKGENGKACLLQRWCVGTQEGGAAIQKLIAADVVPIAMGVTIKDCGRRALRA